MVTVANEAFYELLLNWIAFVEPHNIPFIVGALDDQIVERCKAAGVPVVHLQHAGFDTSLINLAGAYTGPIFISASSLFFVWLKGVSDKDGRGSVDQWTSVSSLQFGCTRYRYEERRFQELPTRLPELRRAQTDVLDNTLRGRG
jgi:hypothetical protein